MSETKRPRQKHSAKAFDEGKEARESGQRRESCPYSPDQRPQVRAWQIGWDSLGPLTNVHISAPAGVQCRVTASVGAHFVPAGADLNSMLVYWKPQKALVPCPECRRLQLDSGSQACVSNGDHGGVAFMRCRACNHTFKVPVKEQRGPA